MTRTQLVAFVVFGALALFAMVGALVLLIHRPDASATFTTFVVLILGNVTTAAGTFALLGRQGRSLDQVKDATEQVKRQTNGTLSALLERNQTLHDELVQVKSTHPDYKENRP